MLKMYKKLLVILVLISLSRYGTSQTLLERDTSIDIIENGTLYQQAWAGGINNPQFSSIDLDLDGIKDIIIFDRTGNKLSPYLYKNGEYIFAPEYRTHFPKLHDWVLLEDYNCDGKKDIYTYSTGGFAIYKNTSINSLSFNLENPLVLSDYGSNNFNIYISAVDIPAVVDVDYDGDLDILTFAILGGFVEYHRNMAMELTGHCDTIAFQFEDGCWGKFYEGLNDYILNCLNCQCPPITNNSTSKQKHAGSTLLAIDIDNDNDKDLILGDILYTNLNLLINGGDNQNALISSVDSIFPANTNNTIPTNISTFPAAFYLDINHNGEKDLLVSPNNQNNSKNFKSSWLYVNNGQTNNPNFNFIQENFLQEEMIDLGEGAYPCFFDYNNDNLVDLIVGNYGYFNTNGDPVSSLALFENIGTVHTPSFELVDRDWQNISSINLNTSLNIPSLNLYPTFGDLDGDNDMDLIIGDANGKLHLFKNNGTNPSTFTISAPNYKQIDVGYFATPQLIDVNRDGLLDLIIGEQRGNINYLPNTGSTTNAIFDTIIEDFGKINIDSSIISTGYSSPKLIDYNGSYHLFSGSYSGKIYGFNNIDNNLSGIFNPVNFASNPGNINIWEGQKSALALSDINNDNFYDLILGNYCGGISLFSSDSSATTNVYGVTIDDLEIYPNPSKYQITIKTKHNGNIYLTDIYGKIIKKETKNQYSYPINLSKIKPGIYILKISNISKKIIIY